ncbi:MAG TPA: alpha/beta fold hydrolase [Jatrophihabitantaceae bacterium]|nr:alpha/beta fold hydrolase [Jatrophihabitantaceae bacterium]
MSRQLELGSGTPTTIETGRGPIAALQAGASDGIPVLLVPGFTGSKEDFGPLLDPLAAAGLRPVAIDLPGQFESPPPATPSLAGGPPPGPDDPAAYSTEALGACVRAVAATLGGRVHLVGHSFGGLVGRAAVLADPAAFASFVLMDSGPAALTGPRAERIALLAPHLPTLGVAGVYQASEAAAASEPGYVPPPADLAAFLEKRFLAGSAAMLQGMGDALLAEPDRVAELAATGVPLLVIYGAADDAWPPPVQDEMAERLGAPVVAVPDAAHSPAVENPPVTAAALVEFWQRVGRG